MSEELERCYFEKPSGAEVIVNADSYAAAEALGWKKGKKVPTPKSAPKSKETE